MRVFVCGDTHGDMDIDKIDSNNKFWRPIEKGLNPNDFLIILGDSGINWSNDLENKSDYLVKEFYRRKKYAILDVLGNHHNYDRLLQQTPIDFYGGKAYHITENIYALRRGDVFDFDGIKIFSMGGGYSIDKNYRVEHWSWWEEEMPCKEEYDRALFNLEQNNWKVDYVLTHTCSNKAFNKLYKSETSYKDGIEEKPLRDFFDILEDRLIFKKWYFGHFHMDKEVDSKHTVCYNDVPIEIE